MSLGRGLGGAVRWEGLTRSWHLHPSAQTQPANRFTLSASPSSHGWHTPACPSLPRSVRFVYCYQEQGPAPEVASFAIEPAPDGGGP